MKLITKILNQSEKPWYSWVVCLMTICESIFLFIPPEVFMTPAIVANKKRAFPIVLAAALGSVIGGAIAYYIGATVLYHYIGSWLVSVFTDPTIIPDPSNTDEVIRIIHEQWLNPYGFWIIAITALTPIPYKVLAICLGLCHYPVLLFLGVSAIFRTGRFAIIGYLLWRFQERANAIFKKYSWQITVAAIIFALIGFLIITVV